MTLSRNLREKDNVHARVGDGIKTSDDEVASIKVRQTDMLLSARLNSERTKYSRPVMQLG